MIREGLNGAVKKGYLVLGFDKKIENKNLYDYRTSTTQINVWQACYIYFRCYNAYLTIS
jgi:hypothetical protein